MRKFSWKKTIVAIVYGIVFIIFLYIMNKSPIVLPILLSVLTVLGLKEFYSLMKIRGAKPSGILGLAFGLIFIWQVFLKKDASLPLTFILMVITIPYIQMLIRRTLPNFIDVGITSFGVLYVGFTLSFFIRLYNLSNSVSYIVLVLVLTWAADIGGYIFGLAFGERKLAPSLSPGKTLEGLIGGTTLSIFIVLVLSKIGEHGKWWDLSLNSYIFLAFLISIFAPLGDLYESSIKRYAGVKDTANLLPEHGGILDRFDSLLFTIPLGYYYILWFSK